LIVTPTLLRAEFAKLLKSRGFWAVGLLALIFMIFVQIQSYRLQHDTAIESTRLEALLADPEAIRCGPGPCSQAETTRIQDQLRQELQSNRESLRVGRAALRPKAGSVVAVGFLASACGVAVGLLIGAGGFGLETESRTLRMVVPRIASRWRLLIAKVEAGTTLSLLLVAISSGFLALSNWLVAPRLGPGRGEVVSWNALNVPPLRILILAPILTSVLFVSLGVAAAVVLRSGFRGLVGATALLAFDRVIATYWRGGTRATLSYNMWSFQRGFQSWLGPRVSSVTSQFWPQVYPQRAAGALISGLVLGSAAVLACLVAVLAFRRQDIA